MFEDLTIIHWPDPGLLKISKPVKIFDESLHLLAQRMFQLMRENKGVGLAAPQVGQNIRMFVMNPTGEPNDDRIYVNPALSDGEGEQEDEEGCLSLPEIRVQVLRFKKVHMEARDIEGRTIEQDGSDYIARIWQHEFDHLNGTLLVNRMGAVAKMANRRILKDLEEKYTTAHPAAAKKPRRAGIRI